MDKTSPSFLLYRQTLLSRWKIDLGLGSPAQMARISPAQKTWAGPVTGLQYAIFRQGLDRVWVYKMRYLEKDEAKLGSGLNYRPNSGVGYVFSIGLFAPFGPGVLENFNHEHPE
jgi:hypothetical protein